MSWNEATYEQYSRSRDKYESDLTDEKWDAITPFLP